MTTVKLLEAKLLKEEADKANRIRSGKFSPSSFGRCYRNQYWNRKNEPKSNPMSVESLKAFALGNMVHALIQSLYLPEQCEVPFECEDIHGRADVVIDDTVIDIKSCKSYEFKILSAKDYDIKNKFTNCLQIMTYCHFLHKPNGKLIFIEKEALKIVEFNLKLVDWQMQVVEEINTLRDYWIKDRLPNGEPRAYGGKECKYCNWMNKCYELDGIKLKEGK